MFVLKLSYRSASPPYTSVSTCHICNRRTCHGCFPFKYLWMRNHVGNLITTPTLSVNTDIICICPFVFANLLYTGNNAIESRFAWVSNCIMDIGYKNQISLIDDKKSHFVTHLQNFWRRLVVGASDSVTTVFFQYLKSSFIGSVRHSGSHTSIVLVQT